MKPVSDPGMIVADFVIMEGDNRSKLEWLSQHVTADWQYRFKTVRANARLIEITVPLTIYLFSNAADAAHFRLRFQ